MTKSPWVVHLGTGQGLLSREFCVRKLATTAISMKWAPGIDLKNTKAWRMVTFIELDDGKIYRKALYLMVKTMVSCKFSLKPTQWNMESLMHRHLNDFSSPGAKDIVDETVRHQKTVVGVSQRPRSTIEHPKVGSLDDPKIHNGPMGCQFWPVCLTHIIEL